MAVPSGVTLLHTGGSCPDGYTRVSAADDTFVRSASAAGGTGGASSHSHAGQSHSHAGSHSHTIGSHTHSISDTSSTTGSTSIADSPRDTGIGDNGHSHSYSDSLEATGANTGATDPGTSTETGTTSSDAWLPPYIDVLACKKD